LPSRLNPTTGVQHVYSSCVPYANLIIKCQLWWDGTGYTPPVEGPHDNALGGDLFSCYFIEGPSSSYPPIIQTANYSSIILVSPSTKGHYLLGIFRPNGGAQMLHFTCE